MRPKFFGQTVNAPVDFRTRTAIEQMSREANTTMAEIIRGLLAEGLKAKGIDFEHETTRL